MQTQCPKCSTIFRMTENQLEVAMGIVRCGQCQNVFNALHQQIQEDSDTTEELIPSLIDDHEPKEQLRRALSPIGKPRNKWAILGWSVGILSLSIVLTAQLAYWQRELWVQKPFLRPYIEQACASLPNCEMAAKRDISKLELLSRNIYTHPNIKEALMISAVISNKADFTQPYPLLLVSMSNVRGQIVAQRYFKPTEYLLANYDEQAFNSNATFTVNLEIADPGNDAIAFELDFL